jgi:energy-converting hydrogenase Eha subunit E
VPDGRYGHVDNVVHCVVARAAAGEKLVRLSCALALALALFLALALALTVLLLAVVKVEGEEEQARGVGVASNDVFRAVACERERGGREKK